jgi:hypothetical protein
MKSGASDNDFNGKVCQIMGTGGNGEVFTGGVGPQCITFWKYFSVTNIQRFSVV